MMEEGDRGYEQCCKRVFKHRSGEQCWNRVAKGAEKKMVAGLNSAEIRLEK